MNKTTYLFVSDPGHGWLRVPLAEIDALSLAPQITAYSYIDRREGWAYLEEDLDACTFAYAAMKRDDYPGDVSDWFTDHVTFTHQERTPIRNLPHYA